jgi:hydroxyacylglutathione hydrolase
MFLEKVRSEGLAHLSWMLGDKGRAAVIDPRRDCAVYQELARREDVRITHIFETHRNEDYVTGSQELARRTGAAIFHGAALDFAYGNPVSEGDRFSFGDLRVAVLETPGHTFESISLALYDTASGASPLAVFTGDALFIGDAGRTDFFPDRAEEVAGLLHESIFDKLLPLGDQTLLYPAHGAGSVCGSGLAAREFSSLGHERLHNNALKNSEKSAFISRKTAEHHYKPPYFKQMERYNLEGSAPPMPELPSPPALSPAEFADAMEEGMQVIDIREAEAVAGALIPGSFAVPLHMMPAFAGWYLNYHDSVGLVTGYKQQRDIETAVRYLVRLGFDDIRGYLAGGVHAWDKTAREFDSIGTLHVSDLVRRLERKELTLLDVRSREEYESGHLPGALHLYAGQLNGRIEEVPREKPVATFCGSGRRAIIAASILKRHGFERVENTMGSLDACQAWGCPITTEWPG